MLVVPKKEASRAHGQAAVMGTMLSSVSLDKRRPRTNWADADCTFNRRAWTVPNPGANDGHRCHHLLTDLVTSSLLRHILRFVFFPTIERVRIVSQRRRRIPRRRRRPGWYVMYTCFLHRFKVVREILGLDNEHRSEQSQKKNT